jgi:predicted AlkP superfamily pyrophosphatase or phosphodiesterase
MRGWRFGALAAIMLIAGAPPALGQPAAPPLPPAASSPVAAPAAPAEAKPPVTILVSIDGFRADYLTRGVTPNLSALAAAGISAAMRPSFPSITFPNHYTIVTGLRPDRSGIVGNRMEDARRPGEVFTMQSDAPFWWTEGEPIWVTAERAGIQTATMFWPGSNVDWKGVRPHDWVQFNGAISDRQRIDGVIDWLRRPAANRPRLITVYFDEVDHAGHDFGPDAPETTRAVATVDAAIGRLRDGLAELGQPANLVIVADHGMAATSAERVVQLDRLLPKDSFTAIADGPYVGLTPAPGKTARIEKLLLRQHDHFACWRKAELPERLHYGHNDRVPPIVCLAETGWMVLTRPQPADRPVHGGAHGYDNAVPEMRALFLAAGPAIRPLGTLPDFDNVDVAPLLRDLIGLPQDTTLDGNDAPFRAALGAGMGTQQ